MQYGARHLLIKTCKSRNPVSRRTGESTAHVAEADALAELAQLAQKIKAEVDSEEVCFVERGGMRGLIRW